MQFKSQQGLEFSDMPWVPLSIVKGGQAANYMVKAMESDFGRKLYSKTLIRNIAQAVYKVRRWGRGVRAHTRRTLKLTYACMQSGGHVFRMAEGRNDI